MKHMHPTQAQPRLGIEPGSIGGKLNILHCTTELGPLALSVMGNWEYVLGITYLSCCEQKYLWLNQKVFQVSSLITESNCFLLCNMLRSFDPKSIPAGKNKDLLNQPIQLICQGSSSKLSLFGSDRQEWSHRELKIRIFEMITLEMLG